MAGILQIWRGLVFWSMVVLICMAVLTVMNHSSFAPKAHQIRQELSIKAASDVAGSEGQVAAVEKSISEIPIQVHIIGTDEPMSQEENLDSVYLDKTHDAFGHTPEGNYIFQKFRTLYNQMMLPASFRRMLPTGLLGAFCLLGVLLMITTDNSRIFNVSSAIVQDLVLQYLVPRELPHQHTCRCSYNIPPSEYAIARALQ